VALRNLVTAQAGRGPRMIERKNQQRLVTVAVNVAGRDLGSVARDVIERMQEIPRPAGYELTVAGAFEEQERSFRELAISLGLALTLVYMVLACQYESLRDPLIVMFAVPTAAVGVLLTLFLTRTTLNVQSFIGCIMLGGIVVNNAILLVDQAGRLLRSGVDVNEAVAEAGRRRLRPILMTSLTTILALLPLALGMGEGADAQAAMARAVVGGLTASTLITLILVPCLYSLMHARARERAVVTALPATSSA
jgi:HAE1 family hydrophobic/amphiphilic exporter-1